MSELIIAVRREGRPVLSGRANEASTSNSIRDSAEKRIVDLRRRSYQLDSSHVVSRLFYRAVAHPTHSLFSSVVNSLNSPSTRAFRSPVAPSVHRFFTTVLPRCDWKSIRTWS